MSLRSGPTRESRCIPRRERRSPVFSSSLRASGESGGRSRTTSSAPRRSVSSAAKPSSARMLPSPVPPPRPNPFSIQHSSFFSSFAEAFPEALRESLSSIAPLFGLFLVFQFALLKMTLRQALRISIGFVWALIGLSVFLTGVNGGFMQAGRILGYERKSRQGEVVPLLKR
ncbi:MAG: DUF1538 family protein, partial [Kiritimatiellae bacterium]|nr:DUF1538 family protein [Kiritimatiellia bacterium]